MENKEMVTQLIHMLTEACGKKQWETARFMLEQLDAYGFHYVKQDNDAVFKLNGIVYRVPLEEKKGCDDIPDFSDMQTATDETTEDVFSDILKDVQQDVATDTPSSQNPWLTPVSEEPDETISNTAFPDDLKDSNPDDVFARLFGASPKNKEEAIWGQRCHEAKNVESQQSVSDEKPSSSYDTSNLLSKQIDNELDAILHALSESSSREMSGILENTTQEIPVNITEAEPQPVSDNTFATADFSRIDADAVPEKTPGHKFVRDNKASDKPDGFLPPLTGEITPNIEIALSDCVYSIFLADVYEESSIMKQKIFFMVAPFEVSEDTPSSNIFMYAYMDGKNYSSNSLKNPNKNSLYCQIGPYEFFIRGWLKDGQWQSEIKLAGNSLTRHDIFEITNVKHFSPESSGKTNGHIRFRYKGFVNHKDIESLGCVNIFPIDPNTKDFVMIRCIEDFIDVFYSTDDKKVMELQTTDGVKEVRAVCDEYGICRALITDKPEEEEEAMIQ